MVGLNQDKWVFLGTLNYVEDTYIDLVNSVKLGRGVFLEHFLNISFVSGICVWVKPFFVLV